METKASPSLAREVIVFLPLACQLKGLNSAFVEPSLSPLGYDLNFTSMLCNIEGI